MKLNLLWILCITVRVFLIFFIYLFTNKSRIIRLTTSLILCTIGIGFLIKAITGSNDEIQISKVFWHDTRLVHSMLYMLAGYYLYIGKIRISSIVLGLDVIFSFLYRIVTNQ
jgi:hypothetical protein